MKKYLLLDDDGPLAIIKAHKQQGNDRVSSVLRKWPRAQLGHGLTIITTRHGTHKRRLVGLSLEDLQNEGFELAPITSDPVHGGDYIHFGAPPGPLQTRALADYLNEFHDVAL